MKVREAQHSDAVNVSIARHRNTTRSTHQDQTPHVLGRLSPVRWISHEPGSSAYLLSESGPLSSWLLPLEVRRLLKSLLFKGARASLVPQPASAESRHIPEHRTASGDSQSDPTPGCRTLRPFPHPYCPRRTGFLSKDRPTCSTRGGNSSDTRRAPDMGLARGVLPLAQWSICLGARSLCGSTTRRLPMGSRPLERDIQWLGVGKRLLALTGTLSSLDDC